MPTGHAYDVVVVGGGPAGLSAALTLVRARRSVLVADAGEPRNAPASHVHNYLSRDGIAPGDLLAAGRAEVTGYGGVVVTGTAIAAHGLAGTDGGFRVELAGGTSVQARRLLVTAGLVDELPDVPGLTARWGRDVLHCPYCHGYEVRDQALGVLATGPMAVHQSLLFRQLSADVVLFLHTAAAPSEEQLEQLAARGISVILGEVVGLEVSDDRLTGVRLQTGEVVPRQALVVAPRFEARGGVLASLGIETVEQQVDGHVVGSVVPADPAGATALAGVWVAGNVADPRAQVIGSASAGLAVAAAINADLVAADTRSAVAALRAAGRATAHAGHETGAVMFTQQFWDERYGSTSALWSGDPNPQLVTEVAGLPPGSALDVGSGEGADAIWLAQRGWRVTAVDVSRVALERGAGEAARAGPDVAQRIEWRHIDLLAVAAEAAAADAATYDLVTAQFFYVPPDARPAVFRRLAASVTPRGVLLVVGHHPIDLEVPGLRNGSPEMLYTAEDIAALLDPDQWQVVVADRRARPFESQGRTVTAHDAVLRARRLA